MHATNFERCTTVCLAIATCNTITTMEIRDESYRFTFLKITGASLFYHSREFMAQHTGILKIRLRAVKGMEIRAADANSLNTEYRTTLTGLRDLSFYIFKQARPRTDKRFHLYAFASARSKCTYPPST